MRSKFLSTVKLTGYQVSQELDSHRSAGTLNKLSCGSKSEDKLTHWLRNLW